MNIITFDNKAKEQDEFAFLSRTHKFAFEAEAHGNKMLTFHSLDQYFFYLKALFFKSPRTASMIQRHPEYTARYMNKIIRDIPDKSHLDEAWHKNQVSIMRKALYERYQDEDLLEKLLNTKDAILVLADKFNDYWGSGNTADEIYYNNDHYDPICNGRNKLGRLTMDIRAILAY